MQYDRPGGSSETNYVNGYLGRSSLEGYALVAFIGAYGSREYLQNLHVSRVAVPPPGRAPLRRVILESGQ